MYEFKKHFFSFIFWWVFVYMYLCRPSEASTRYCVIPGGYPPQDWQSLPCAGEELDSNSGLLICSQVCYHWSTSPPSLRNMSLLSRATLHSDSEQWRCLRSFEMPLFSCFFTLLQYFPYFFMLMFSEQLAHSMQVVSKIVEFPCCVSLP